MAFILKRKNQPGWPELQWANLTAHSTFSYKTAASGVVNATVSTGGGILKGIFLDDYPNGAITLNLGAADLVFGSGATGLVPGFNFCWVEFKDTLTIDTATAQIYGILVGSLGRMSKDY